MPAPLSPVSPNFLDLQAQLVNAEQEMEKAKAFFYRCDGALILLRQMIALATPKD